MTDLSVTDGCRWRGGDESQHAASRVPPLVNIAHYEKLISRRSVRHHPEAALQLLLLTVQRGFFRACISLISLLIPSTVGGSITRNARVW